MNGREGPYACVDAAILAERNILRAGVAGEPNVIVVRQTDDHWKRHHFKPETSCHVESDPIVIDGKEGEEHTFYINVDNNSLKTEMKFTKQDVRVLEAKFKYGNVLLGLAMLHAHGKNTEKSGTETTVPRSRSSDVPQVLHLPT